MRELTTDKMPEITTDYKRVRTNSYMPVRGERESKEIDSECRCVREEKFREVVRVNLIGEPLYQSG